MDILEEFPDDITIIDISNKKIKGILDFTRFTKLTKLDCSINKITCLDNLPESLRYLDITWCEKLTYNFTNLSIGLKELHCNIKHKSLLTKIPFNCTVYYYETRKINVGSISEENIKTLISTVTY